MARTALITACLMLLPVASSFGQAGAAPDATVALRGSFGKVSTWITKAADMVPADKYSYRPAPTVRTFGEVIAHVADEYAYYCEVASGKNLEWTDAIEKGSKDKASIVQKLKGSTERCNAVYAGTGRTRALVDNLADAYLHYGNIVTYLRMLGLTPPST